jgi:hypothetical protein
MMAVHEAGHVLGALLTGGTVKVVVLHPLKISCTVLSHNPHPLLVTWAGPAIGVLIPLAAFGVAAAIRMPGAGPISVLHLWLFGAVTIPLGLLLWHRFGPYFELGKARGQVSRGAALACLILLVLVVGLELVPGKESSNRGRSTTLTDPPLKWGKLWQQFPCNSNMRTMPAVTRPAQAIALYALPKRGLEPPHP